MLQKLGKMNVFSSENKENIHSELKGMIFWIVMPFSLVEVHWHFRATYHLHLQGQKVI
jgi:hypothetical protein